MRESCRAVDPQVFLDQKTTNSTINPQHHAVTCPGFLMFREQGCASLYCTCQQRSMKDKVPYVLGVIQLDEGPFFHSNVMGCAIDAVKVGMKLQARMELHESGLTVPIFYPA